MTLPTTFVPDPESIVTLVDEKGNEVEYSLMQVFKVEETAATEYAALVSVDQLQRKLADNESYEILTMRVNGETLEQITDDLEAQVVTAFFMDTFNDLLTKVIGA